MVLSLPHDIQREISKHLSVANKIRLGAASKRGAKNNNIAGPVSLAFGSIESMDVYSSLDVSEVRALQGALRDVEQSERGERGEQSEHSEQSERRTERRVGPDVRVVAFSPRHLLRPIVSHDRLGISLLLPTHMFQRGGKILIFFRSDVVRNQRNARHTYWIEAARFVLAFHLAVAPLMGNRPYGYIMEGDVWEEAAWTPIAKRFGALLQSVGITVSHGQSNT